MYVTNKAESWKVYRDELERQGSALLDRLPSIEQQAAEIADRLALNEHTPLYLTGSGDSYIAALSCQWIYRRFTGLPTHVVEAFDIAPYCERLLHPHSVLLSTSISGRTGSAVAALQAGQHWGAQTVVVTNTPGSPATLAADHILLLDLPSIDTGGFIPSTMSYMGGMIAQYSLALALAAHLGTTPADRLGSYRAELRRALTLLDGLLHALDEPIAYWSRAWNGRVICLVGGGTGYGTAHFGAAKIIESAMTPVTVQHVEEWAHIQRFVTGPHTPSIFLATPGRSRARMLQIMRSARDHGAEIIAIAEADDVAVAALADVIWPVPALVDEMLQPLTCAVPLELLAYWAMVQQDVRPFYADTRPIQMTLTIPQQEAINDQP